MLLEMFMKKGEICCINDSTGSSSWLSVQIVYFGEHVELGKILDQIADQKDGWQTQPVSALQPFFSLCIPLVSLGSQMQTTLEHAVHRTVRQGSRSGRA